MQFYSDIKISVYSSIVNNSNTK